MKKITALLICVIIALVSLNLTALADTVQYTDLPVVIVAGYAGPQLAEADEQGNENVVWYPDFGEIPGILLSRIAEVGAGLGAAVFGRPDYLAKVVGEETIAFLGKVRCNDDGSSVYNLKPTIVTAHESNYQVLFDKYGDGTYQHEPDITAGMMKYISRSQLYSFYCDWRMGAVDCASRLDEFIQEVKEDSGKDQVNIFCLSHGGQVTATYLTLYGSKRDVKNACLTVPAAGGAGMAYDILTQQIKFDENNLVRFIEHGTMTEDDYHWLVEATKLGFLDDVLNALVPYLCDVAGHWGSIWDFCPTEAYEQMKARWLDADKNAEIIRKSDYMHYEIMPKFYTELQRCNDEYGMNVSIIAGTDINMTSGWQAQGDGIIPTKSSTGAECTDVGERFPDGYVQKNPCGGHYKLSPAMTIDASTGYMPDNTWFVSGLFHGMTYWDEYTRELLMLLTLTDEIKDVYSDERFPQFHASSNPSNAVSAQFDKSVEGYLSGDDTCLILKNLTEQDRTLLIKSVVCDCGDIYFAVKPFTVLRQGETVEIPLRGNVPEKSNTRVNVTVSYTSFGSVTPLGERTFAFTLLNGEIPETDGNIIADEIKTPFDNSLFGFMSGFLRSIGFYNFVSMIYTAVYGIFSSFIKGW